MAVLTIQRMYQYEDSSKEQTKESLKYNCREKYLNIFPLDIYMFCIVVNV